MPQSPAPKQSKRTSSAPKKRMKLAAFLMVCLLIPIFMTAYNQYNRLMDNTSELNVLKKELAEKTKANQAVQDEIERLKDPEYRQEKIRTELNVAKEGETIFDPPSAP